MTTASRRRPSRSTISSSGGQNLEHAIVIAEIGGGARAARSTGKQLVTLAELHVARDLRGLPPAPDVGGRAHPGRHAPAGGRDDEAVEAEAGDVGQLRERAERQRPGGVLAPQAPADQEAGDPRGRGARAQSGKRRRDDRAAGRALAQRERVRRVGIGDQLERGGRKLAVAVAVFAVVWLQRESASVRRDVFGRAARSVSARRRREGDVDRDLQRARPPFGRLQSGHRVRRVARPARGRSVPAMRRRARAGPAASPCRAVCADAAAPAPGTARRCREAAGRDVAQGVARAPRGRSSPRPALRGAPPRSRRAPGSAPSRRAGGRASSSPSSCSSTP